MVISNSLRMATRFTPQARRSLQWMAGFRIPTVPHFYQRFEFQKTQCVLTWKLTATSTPQLHTFARMLEEFLSRHFDRVLTFGNTDHFSFPLQRQHTKIRAMKTRELFTC